MKDYLKNIDTDAFYAWLRATGWTEDTSPGTENWDVPAWWHEGKMKLHREDWLVDDYEDHLYVQEQAAMRACAMEAAKQLRVHGVSDEHVASAVLPALGISTPAKKTKAL